MSLQKKVILCFQAMYIIVAALLIVEGFLGCFDNAMLFTKFNLATFVAMIVAGFTIIVITTYFIIREFRRRQ